MAFVGSRALSFLFAAVVATSFLSGIAFAADALAPAPAPASAAGTVYPPLAVAVLASFVALLLGSLRH